MNKINELTSSAETGEDYHQSLANYVPLTPISFLERAARVHRDKTAIIYGRRRWSYREFFQRSLRLAAALVKAGIKTGDRVAVMLPNIPEMLEAHFGVPMAGGVLCAINTRLDPDAVRFILQHSNARVLVVDREYSDVVTTLMADLESSVTLVTVDDKVNPQGGPISGFEYEEFLESGKDDFAIRYPADEWESVALNYTSGTTSDPKGVLLHHRGAYLNACANALTFELTHNSVYLWTLPMFHCNGWTYTWAVTMLGSTHVCMRKVEAPAIFSAIEQHEVTHMCAAPIVLGMLLQDSTVLDRKISHKINIATGGAAPPSAVIARMDKLGFSITHLYGMTECYGPSLTCLMSQGMDTLSLDEKAAFMSRQGGSHPMVEAFDVIDQETGRPVARDGKTIGELVLRGNTVMKGYYKNVQATEKALADGWLHTGDLAVIHPDHYVEIKDRLKDIIISGGENISSIEVENILYQHPDIIEAAVVARPDEKWGETPHAFVTLRQDLKSTATAEDLIEWCRGRLAHFKCPRYITFCDLPKTSTGKIQKFLLREFARNKASQSNSTD